MRSNWHDARTKPPPGRTPNPAHPLCPSFAWLFNEAAGGRAADCLAGAHGTLSAFGLNALSGSSGWVDGGLKFLSNFGATSYVTGPATASLGLDWPVGTRMSAVCRVRATACGAYGAIISCLSTNGQSGWLLTLNASTGVVTVTGSAGGSAVLSASGATNVVDGRPHVVGFSLDRGGALLRVYVDGRDDTSGTPATNNTFSVAGGTVLQFGAYNSAGNGYGGLLDAVTVYRRALTAAEHYRLAAEPYGWISRRSWYVPPAGSTPQRPPAMIQPASWATWVTE